MSKATDSKPIPKQERQNAASLNFTATATSVYTSPLPPADEMKKYESICKGTTDRILTMAEKQAEHRQNIEAIAVKASSERSILGVKYAYHIALAAFVLSGFCFYFDHVVAGGAIFGSTLVSIVTAFIYGTRSNRQEREDKWEKAQYPNSSSQS